MPDLKNDGEQRVHYKRDYGKRVFWIFEKHTWWLCITPYMSAVWYDVIIGFC